MSVVRLADYQAPIWQLDEISLCLDLDAKHTRVHCRLQLQRPSSSPDDLASLVLDGAELQTEWVKVDGRLLSADQYQIRGAELHIADLPARCVVETAVIINPDRNTRLEGLYASVPMLLTQC